MRPLNEYPKEELEILEGALNLALKDSGELSRRLLYQWLGKIHEAISDQDFKDKELPFKTEDNESREFEL